MKRSCYYRLKLYVVRGTDAGERAIQVLKRLSRRLAGMVESEIVDAALVPERCQAAHGPGCASGPQLKPTPVVVREHPLPVVSYEGSLTDPDQVIRALKLRP